MMSDQGEGMGRGSGANICAVLYAVGNICGLWVMLLVESLGGLCRLRVRLCVTISCGDADGASHVSQSWAVISERLRAQDSAGV